MNSSALLLLQPMGLNNSSRTEQRWKRGSVPESSKELIAEDLSMTENTRGTAPAALLRSGNATLAWEIPMAANKMAKNTFSICANVSSPAHKMHFRLIFQGKPWTYLQQHSTNNLWSKRQVNWWLRDKRPQVQCPCLKKCVAQEAKYKPQTLMCCRVQSLCAQSPQCPALVWMFASLLPSLPRARGLVLIFQVLYTWRINNIYIIYTPLEIRELSWSISMVC